MTPRTVCWTLQRAIAETISHEARHLIGTLEHGGEGIGRYAEGGYVYYYYLNNKTIRGEICGSVGLARYPSNMTIVSSSYQSSGGNDSICVGTNYVSAVNAVPSTDIVPFPEL